MVEVVPGHTSLFFLFQVLVGKYYYNDEDRELTAYDFLLPKEKVPIIDDIHIYIGDIDSKWFEFSRYNMI